MDEGTRLRERLTDVLPLAFGVSGVLTSPLMGQRDMVELLNLVADNGVQMFDTSPSYGAGRGETYLSEAFSKRADIFVMTKVGLIGRALRRPRRDFSAQNLKHSVAASLGRLKRDRIDLLWLHGPNPYEINEEVLAVLADMRQSGDVAYFGVAGRGAEVLLAKDYDIFSCAMMPVHPAMSADQKGYAADLRAAKKMVLAIEVLSGHTHTTRSKGAIWRKAKSLVGRGRPQTDTAHLSIPQRIVWPLETGLADMITSSTSVKAHALNNIQTLQALTT